jgi:lipopolysaccharide/colanic/teichoic acid biosynthesis glycosyltransferase
VAAACALAIRREGGPGILVRRERVGPDGRPFSMLTFRAMPRPGEPDDPTTGPVGRLLRHTSLDELPRLWNVVRGDMSLVGPRPERPFHVPALARRTRTTARHRVPAGITGWAQINGIRQATDLAERVRFADYYVESWSLWEDVKILLRATGQVARDGGARMLRTSGSRVQPVTPTVSSGE